MFGPDAASLILSTTLISGPAVAFCTKVSLIIRHHIQDGKNAIPWYYILAVAALLTILDVMFLLLTSSRDPGIVPRNSSPAESSEIFDINTPSMEWVNGRTPHLKLPRSKDVIVNGHAVRVKYCDTCLLYRPPRASHCSICNNCVQKFDHHCPWVGQCIGIRNYRFFYMFISTSTVLCIYVFTFSCLNIVQHDGSIWMAISEDILSDFLIVYSFIAVWFVGGLTVFHFYLICTNQTTYENFRYRYDTKENPYNKGVFKNLGEVFFSKIPPSVHDFRAVIVEDKSMQLEGPIIDIVEGITSSKEKIDIEMGTNPGEYGGFSLPDILRNLDYHDMEESVTSKEWKRSDTDPYLFGVEQESRDSIMMPVEGVGKTDSEPSFFVSEPESTGSLSCSDNIVNHVA